MGRHSSKPPQATGETLVASAPSRRSLAELMHQERPTALTASFLNVPPPPRPPSGGPNVTRHELNIPPRTTPGKNQPIINSTAGPLGTQASDGTFVATGRWNGTTTPHSASPSRTEPLQRHEAQLTGYQLGAKLNGDAIDNPDDRSRLAQATQTVHDTRLHLRRGRANVSYDVHVTGGRQHSQDFRVVRYP